MSHEGSENVAHGGPGEVDKEESVEEDLLMGSRTRATRGSLGRTRRTEAMCDTNPQVGQGVSMLASFQSWG